MTDGLRKSDEDNPKGYYEVELVKSLKKQADKSWIDGAEGKVIKVVSSLLKDLPSKHQYDVVFMNRSIDEVIASQNKMIERRGDTPSTDDQQMQELYQLHLSSIKSWLAKQQNFRVLEVSYNEIVQSPAGQAQRVRDFLGRPLSVDKMSEAVDEQLYRNRGGSAGKR